MCACADAPVLTHAARACLRLEQEKIHTYHMESMAENNRHGVSFGELALLYPNQPRSATIKCIEDGKLWRLHAKAFKDIVMRSSTQKILKTLRSVEALKELTLSQLQRLYDANQPLDRAPSIGPHHTPPIGPHPLVMTWRADDVAGMTRCPSCGSRRTRTSSSRASRATTFT
jgi:hypothetical protein